MFSTLQKRYQRMEKALDALIDSVSAYNPSLTAADELVAADEAVSEGLVELATHHSNYGRILALRQTAAALDDQIKSTVRLVADTRKQLLSISTPLPDTSAREVRVEELLSYAKFISKTTVPPTFRRPIPKGLLSAPPAEIKTEHTSGAQITNGIPTPDAGNADGENGASQPTSEGIGVSKLDQQTKAMLDPVSHLPFVPWPSQEVIGAGALAFVQSMLENGRDPSSVLSQEEQQAEDRRKAEEEERLKAEEEERQRKRRESMMALGGSQRQAANEDEDVFDPDA